MNGERPDDRRLVAACLLGSYDGTEVPEWLLEHVRGGLGGVLLFAQNVVDDAQVAATCARLREARADVLVAIDEEGGDVTRLDAATGSDTPAPAAFGFVDDVELTRGAFADLGRRVHALGIDLTLAPCADINSNPKNPVIGLRSFGSEAEGVARHVVAAIEGFRAGGVAVCAKHYPGHGDTSTDTHREPARVDGSLDALVQRELVPFAAAVRAGTDAVLTAHVVAPALDEEPVSLSARWTQQLRESTGFHGSVITDALDMDAVAQGRGIDGVADAAVRALVAGADLLCLGSNFDAAMTDAVIDRVVDALGRAEIERGALAASAARNAALRREACHSPQPVSNPCAAAIVARAAVVVDGDLPAGPFAVLECRPRGGSASFNVSWGVAAELERLGWTTRRIGEADDVAASCRSFVEAAGRAPILVVVRDLEVHPWQRTVVAAVREAADQPVVVAEMGWPSQDQPEGVGMVVTHGAARSSGRALLDRLTGGATPAASGTWTSDMEES